MANPLRPTATEALAEWASRVRENREQVDRVREVGDGPDFYAPVASRFQADPFRTDDPSLDVLRSMIAPGETWLDVGAGGGRYALPIALLSRQVVALDPSTGMLDILRAGMAQHQIANIHVVQARWPLDDYPAHLPRPDVALISHVGYDIEEIGPFLDSLEAVAADRCVAIFMDRPPASEANDLWPAVHGEPRAALPSLPEFLALQLARERLCEVRLAIGSALPSPDPERALAFARRQTWVQPGSAKDQRLEALIHERFAATETGNAASDRPVRIGIVSWRCD
jgi:SAM-dependent methyltransferase